MLLLDAGNTLIKWALARDGVWVQQGTAPVADQSVLRQAFASLPPPRRILVSNVAGESVAQFIRDACSAWPCNVEFISAQVNQGNVRNAYEQPAQLGSDRWAALIAARHLTQTACLVVNCGTATTVDALSGSGEFLGGLILPGIAMMQRSLAAGTAQLGMSVGSWREFPRSTADAIYSGAIQATAGAIRLQFDFLGAPDARCLLSGGAASLIHPHLGLPLLRMDDLVLHGLQLIGQESDKV